MRRLQQSLFGAGLLTLPKGLTDGLLPKLNISAEYTVSGCTIVMRRLLQSSHHEHPHPNLGRVLVQRGEGVLNDSR